jgi:hypothetical protein
MLFLILCAWGRCSGAHAQAPGTSAESSDIEVIEVLGEITKTSEAAQLNLRQEAAVIKDNISAEAIKLSPDADVGEIVQRIPAVTVRDSKYLNVRGLNERYTSALLNGNRLPSTDPERRVVPLDIFPADFIESVSLVKTYTPDLPGDFSGGLADIRLRSYPEELTASLGVSTGFNTQTTFQHFDTYHGPGAPDWFGFGQNYRDIPSLIPSSNIQSPPWAQAQAYGRSFRNIWDPGTMTAPPGYSTNFSLGNSFGDFGLALGGNYSTDHKLVPDEIRRRLVVEGENPDGSPIIEVADDFKYDSSIFETGLGGLLSGGWQPAEGHSLSLFSLYTRKSEDSVRRGQGQVESSGAARTTQLKYSAEDLALAQLAGTHVFPHIEVDWRSALSRSTQDQPDGRFTTYVDQNNDGKFLFVPDSSGGSRIFGFLEESMTDSAVDFALPFQTPTLPELDWWSNLDAKFKAGPAYAFRRRQHDLRRFRYRITPIGNTALNRAAPAEELLAPENIGPQGFNFIEETQPRDSFKASQEIAGGYGMVELPLYPGVRGSNGVLRHQLRFIGGVRTEYSYIQVDTTDQTGKPVRTFLNDLDPLPGINLVYSPVEDMNVRLGWSQAVSRPEFRELSPVRYPAPQGLVATLGNPFLTSSTIESYDLRWEWFLSETELMSLSVFYKTLQDPIEQITTNEASNVIFTFVNADKATVAGCEIEARGHLGELWQRLDPFDLTTNFTYAYSNVKIPQAGEGQVTTSGDRELVGQAPYVVNVSLDYTNDFVGKVRLLYNIMGEQIIAAGANRLPDIYEESRHQLDLVLVGDLNLFDRSFKGKLAIENIVNDKYVNTQDDIVWRSYRSGVKMSLGLSYSFF